VIRWAGINWLRKGHGRSLFENGDAFSDKKKVRVCLGKLVDY
jgi:hypothetical protein